MGAPSLRPMAVDWIPPPDSAEDARLMARLGELREEHRALDAAIAALA
jgi:hypothetical protein